MWARTGPGGGYVLDERRSLPPINLNAAQAVALSAAVVASSGAPFGDAARAATRKVLDVLDPATRSRRRPSRSASGWTSAWGAPSGS